jgi:hypothetical protein
LIFPPQTVGNLPGAVGTHVRQRKRPREIPAAFSKRLFLVVDGHRAFLLRVPAAWPAVMRLLDYTSTPAPDGHLRSRPSNGRVLSTNERMTESLGNIV